MSSVFRETEIGLALPDGTQVWPPDEYRGFPIKDQTDRENFVSNLKNAALELHFPEADFLSKFQWVVRERITAVTYEDRCVFPITDLLSDSDPLSPVVSELAESSDADH